MAEKNNKIELWEGYEVEVNGELLKDADFVNEYRDAIKNDDLKTFTMMTVALASGDGGENVDKVYDDIRQHLIEKTGRFDVDELSKILKKITGALPKAGNRAQRRSWKTSK